jgi:hypothetical protein
LASSRDRDLVLRFDTHPEIEWTGFPSCLGEVDRVDGRPLDFKGIKELVDLFT